MHKINKKIAQFEGLIAMLILAFGIPFGLKADQAKVPSYKLNTITITSTGAMEPMVAKPYPYLRLAKWLTPTTHISLIDKAINLPPGTIFDAKALLSIKQRLMALPYFATVSVMRKIVDPTTDPIISDLIIKTKDRFPISLGVSLDEGPLLTIMHANAWGYGHSFSQQFFLKKRWGYGCTYELPKLHGHYLFGGDYYKQIGSNYRFDHQNVWAAKLFASTTEESYAPYYWITGLSGYKKVFVTALPVSAIKNTSYHDYTLVLGKIGWVADVYQKLSGLYALHDLEKLPKGGSAAMLYGYQKGQFNNRHYIGVHCIKNIVKPRFRYMHINCESGSFLHKNRWEEAILKLGLAYVGPSIQRCNGAHQSVAIDYIIGCRMPKERMLGIMHRDPEVLEAPEVDNSLQAPIYARLNLHLDSTLHMPIVLSSIRFVVLAFTNFIALYNRDNQLLNQTFVDTYGMGLHLEHATKSWPGVALKVGYSPLLGKVVPSVKLAIHTFKNKTEAKPTLVSYS
ncbi:MULTISPECIES: hypothetical protein [unclassified Candidatus Cardinium]|uniref:hypothetical protein n=1 Tax=unclassified Candidatus Cardinium TaxID=2641185 RepID=UPI001FB1DB72|nr:MULTISPECIES: hypothetical protein [unclassified Candidatus Cardinium]